MDRARTGRLVVAGVDEPGDLAARLASAGYLADEGLATAAFLALRMGRPLFLEGEAGVGKTALAQALADVAGAPLIRLQCYEGLDAAQALYDWDFPRQLLHLRAAEAARRRRRRGRRGVDLYDRRFLVARPLLQALETQPGVLLVDEVDRADDEFEAFLLEVLSDFTITVPELGTVQATTAAARRPHQQPHPRGARRAEAPLPLPLARPPGVRARGRDHPAAPAGGHRAAGRRGRPGDGGAAHARTCSSRRASPSRSTGPRRCSRSAPARSTRTAPRARSARC